MEKAREATDLANQRAAKATAVAAYLDSDGTGTATYYYDAANGVTAAAKGSIAGYGKGTATVGSSANAVDGYAPGEAYTNKVCKVTITGGDTTGVTIAWE